MDINALLGTLLSEESIAGLSQKTGASQDQIKDVMSNGLPNLLNGAKAQSDNGDTLDGFVGALAQHAGVDTSNLSEFLENVDLEDGKKIVGHLLGGERDTAVQEISEKTGITEKDTGNILSATAPLLMSLLGQQTQQSQKEDENAGVSSLMGSLLGGVDLSSLLLGMLGGGSSSGKKKESLLGSLLGGLLGKK